MLSALRFIPDDRDLFSCLRSMKRIVTGVDRTGVTEGDHDEVRPSHCEEFACRGMSRLSAERAWQNFLERVTAIRSILRWRKNTE